MRDKGNLTLGKVPSVLVRLAIPMVFGMLGMVIFNLTDTYFVGQLGSDQLAALSFTFPVVLVLNAFAQGVGLSSSALVSRAAGEQNRAKVRRLATDSLLLGVFILAIILSLGLFTINPLFRLLGADGVILGYIRDYMTIWYFGSVMVVIPMIGNNIIRALGDTKTPGLVMAISAIINIILDPLLIFGLGPFPALGIRGAAIATVIARSMTAVIALNVLYFREKVISAPPGLAIVGHSWKQLLYIAAPNALINMALPLGSGAITRILAAFAPAVVAGFGVATRVEMFSLVFIGALAAVTGPFVGQNLGARKWDRVQQGIKTGVGLSLGIGALLALVLALFARPIAAIFSDDLRVIATTAKYLRIVPIAYGMQGMLRIGATVLNVLRKPFHSSLLIIFQTFGLYIPLAHLTSRHWGVTGIFASLAVSYFVAGFLAQLAVRRQVQRFAVADRQRET